MNGILTQVQIDKLSELGMRWGKASDLAWEKYYASARRYYEQNSNLKPVALYVDDGVLRSVGGSHNFVSIEKVGCTVVF